MTEGFLVREVGSGIPFSGTVEVFLFLVSRSVNMDPFLVRGPPSGAVEDLRFRITSSGMAEAFLFRVSKSVKVEAFLFRGASSGTVETFLSFLFLSTL